MPRSAGPETMGLVGAPTLQGLEIRSWPSACWRHMPPLPSHASSIRSTTRGGWTRHCRRPRLSHRRCLLRACCWFHRLPAQSGCGSRGCPPDAEFGAGVEVGACAYGGHACVCGVSRSRARSLRRSPRGPTTPPRRRGRPRSSMLPRTARGICPGPSGPTSLIGSTRRIPAPPSSAGSRAPSRCRGSRHAQESRSSCQSRGRRCRRWRPRRRGLDPSRYAEARRLAVRLPGSADHGAVRGEQFGFAPEQRCSALSVDMAEIAADRLLRRIGQ